MEKTWYTKELKPHAQELRRNMTKEERRLWYDFLRNLQITVKRQRIIGSYIADFYIPSEKLVIELDGSQHYSEEGTEYDRERDDYMKSLGLTVLRYSNSDISGNFNGVCEDILLRLTQKKPSPGGEGVSEADG